jgi:hypothetical protein
MTVEQRLARLEAIEAIRDLKARYFHACDHKQVEDMRDCFMPGRIELDFGRVGCFDNRDELAEVFRQLACHDHIVEMHHGQNPRIEVDASDQASGTWGLYYYLIDTRQQIVTQLGATYTDIYRCVGGQWKISASRCEVTSTQIFELGEGMARVIFAGRTAPRELDDPEKQAG